MKTSKSYEIDHEAAADAFCAAVRKLVSSASGEAAEDADSIEWEEIKLVLADYQIAKLKALEIEQHPERASLNDPDLRFQKRSTSV